LSYLCLRSAGTRPERNKPGRVFQGAPLTAWRDRPAVIRFIVCSPRAGKRDNVFVKHPSIGTEEWPRNEAPAPDLCPTRLKRHHLGDGASRHCCGIPLAYQLTQGTRRIVGSAR
jgi:hypothetical protein